MWKYHLSFEGIILKIATIKQNNNNNNIFIFLSWVNL